MDKKRVKPALTDEELDKVSGGTNPNDNDACDQSPTGRHVWGHPDDYFVYCIHCNKQKGKLVKVL